MRKLITILAVTLALVVQPYTVKAEEGPATYFISASGTMLTGNDFALDNTTGTFRIGVKTDLGGNYRLITVYRQIQFGDALDAKSLQVGGEITKYLGYEEGFLKGSSMTIRGAFDFELNQVDNDVNGALGFGWLKPLGDQEVFALESFVDFTFKDGKDYITIGLSLEITPPL